ncbi:hypothetical protein RJ639_046380 [Escallonia herrerae]|uniref:E3 ubiquitin-protein ligase PRT1 n=1 Tax=Escallonia herrerae TaxID=1293975 RepID=A0AA88W5V1_9ASTE|nr:hypothetical protein RJ639_046380 [Escallonia herrerae]
MRLKRWFSFIFQVALTDVDFTFCCRDLLYKPVVLACGHVSCFWCVHRSMSVICESHCPVCRSPYQHFPTICQLLHFLLLKLYPATYKRRENQVLEDEKKSGHFSPQIDRLVSASHAKEGLNHVSDLAQFAAISSQDSLSSDPCFRNNGEACVNIQQLNSVSSSEEHGRTYSKEKTGEGLEVIGGHAVDEKLWQRNYNGSCKQVSVGDVLCASCKQLLFRPVVLNCGHVYCEACMVIMADETLKCQVCESPHPSGFPKVCWELHHFLGEQFPEAYALRNCNSQLTGVHSQHNGQTTCSTKSRKRGVNFSFPAEDDHIADVHIGAGCDSCGMYPIIGDRYRCRDCVEDIGFDLCGDCYNTRSKLPGRFNQQHTPEHKFELVKSTAVHDMMLRLLRGQLEDVSAAIRAAEALETPENVFPSPANDAPENSDSDVGGDVSVTDAVEDQTDEESLY